MSSIKVSIFPIFDECKKYTLDEYWQHVFSCCAKNKFPHGLKYDDKQHAVFVKNPKLKRVYDTIHLSKKPETLYKSLIKIFRENLGLRSARDLEIQETEIDRFRKTSEGSAEEHTWQKLKKYNKDRLLHEFVYSVKEQYQLTPQETKYLMSQIFIGLQFKYIISEDVVYEEGRVIGIKGLTFRKESRTFYFKHKRKTKFDKIPENKGVRVNQFTRILDSFMKEVYKKT